MKQVPRMLLGLKSDLPHNITNEDLSEFIEKHGFFAHEQCSAKTSTGIAQVFQTIAKSFVSQRIEMSLSCQKVKRMDWCSESDPFVVLKTR